jgi:hypothetical protein
MIGFFLRASIVWSEKEFRISFKKNLVFNRNPVQISFLRKRIIIQTFIFFHVITLIIFIIKLNNIMLSH